MTNEEAKVFLDNLKICINEHPIVADWLVEIADRKTEPNSSEKPNNCEVKNYCDDCLYTDTCDSKEFFYACTSKATISKMEQVDEPKTQAETQNSNLTFEKADEPQTDNLFTDKDGDVWEWRGDAWYCISGDEPQTDCAWR